MNTINIQINTDNAAFDDRLTDELSFILDARKIINQLADSADTNGFGHSCIKLFDSNGNTVGMASVSDEPNYAAQE